MKKFGDRRTRPSASRALTVVGLLIAALLWADAAAALSPGTVRLMRTANIPFERYSVRPTPAEIAFIDRRFDRMMVYTPFFDRRLAWYPRAWFYRNAYALYPEADITREHPEWILRDAAGRRLYIPWGCSGGTCPAYAANILDPAFRAWWISVARRSLAAGYRGIFVDDFSLTRRVSDGAGTMVAPIDPVTGREIGEAAWADAMSAFAEEIRRAFLSVEIVHNSVWFFDSAGDSRSPVLRREIAAADYVMLEFGVTDRGVAGGDGPFSLAALMRYVDAVHGLGRAVILADTPADAAGRLYALACYFLVSDGRDLIGDEHVTPDSPAPVYDVRLGAAEGPRYRWHGLWRRDFAGGTVVVNEPGAPPASLAGLAGRTPDGTPLPASLPPRAGAIIVR